MPQMPSGEVGPSREGTLISGGGHTGGSQLRHWCASWRKNAVLIFPTLREAVQAGES